MTEEVGRAPSGQALAVPATPADAVDGPSGFDPSRWRPIETAPKDGTRILTFGRGHGNHIMAHDANERSFPMYSIAYWGWHDSERDVEVSPGLFRKEPCRVLEGWRTEWSYTPTHWMPLPEPPMLEALARGEGDG